MSVLATCSTCGQTSQLAEAPSAQAPRCPRCGDVLAIKVLDDTPPKSAGGSASGSNTPPKAGPPSERPHSGLRLPPPLNMRARDPQARRYGGLRLKPARHSDASHRAPAPPNTPAAADQPDSAEEEPILAEPAGAFIFDLQPPSTLRPAATAPDKSEEAELASGDAAPAAAAAEKGDEQNEEIVQLERAADPALIDAQRGLSAEEEEEIVELERATADAPVMMEAAEVDVPVLVPIDGVIIPGSDDPAGNQRGTHSAETGRFNASPPADGEERSSASRRNAYALIAGVLTLLLALLIIPIWWYFSADSTPAGLKQKEPTEEGLEGDSRERNNAVRTAAVTSDQPGRDAARDDSTLPSIVAVGIEEDDSKQISLRPVATWSVVADPAASASAELTGASIPLPWSLRETGHLFVSTPSAARAVLAAKRPDGKQEGDQSAEPQDQYELVTLDLVEGKTLHAFQLAADSELHGISPTGKHLITIDAAKPGHVDIWTAAGEHVAGWRTAATDAEALTNTIAWCALLDDEHAATLSADFELVVWRLPAAQALYRLRLGSAFHPVQSPGGRWLALFQGGAVQLIEALSGEPHGTIALGATSIAPRAMAFSPDGRRLAAVVSSSAGNVCYVCDLESGKILDRFAIAHADEELAWSGQRYLVSGGKQVTDTQTRLNIWNYFVDFRGPKPQISYDNRAWLVMDNRGVGVLGWAIMPHPEALQAVREGLGAEGHRVLGPNDGVRVQFHAASPTEYPNLEQETVQGLKQALQSHGFKVDDGGGFQLVVDVVREASDEKAAYDFFREVEVSATKLNCNVRLTDSSGRSIWKHQHTIGMPAQIQVNRRAAAAEYEQAARRSQWGDFVSWTRNLSIPRYIAQYQDQFIHLPGVSLLQPQSAAPPLTGVAGGAASGANAKPAEQVLHWPIVRIAAHTDALTAIAYHPTNPQLVAVCDGRGHLGFWDLNSKTLVGGTQTISGANHLQFTADGTALLITGRSGEPMLLDVSKPKFQVRPVPQVPWSRQMTISSDGTMAVVAAERRIGLFDLGANKFIRVLASARVDFGPMRFSPDGHELAVAAPFERSVQILRVEDGHITQSLSNRRPHEAQFSYSADGSRFAITDGHGVDVFDTHDWKLIKRVPLTGRLVAFSPDGTRLAAAEEGQITIGDVETGALLFTFHAHEASIRALAFSPDSQSLASVCDAGKLCTWKSEPHE